MIARSTARASRPGCGPPMSRGITSCNAKARSRRYRTITDGLVAAYTFDEDSPPFQDGEATFAPHGTGRAAVFEGKRFVDAGDVGNFGYFDRFTLSAWIKPDDVKTGTIVSRMVVGATQALESDGHVVDPVVDRRLGG